MAGIFSSHEQAAPKAYEHQPFPSVRYHRSGTTQLVHSEDEHDALVADPDWSDTPAAFDAEVPAAKKSSKKKD
jgi:hypothetical protein